MDPAPDPHKGFRRVIFVSKFRIIFVAAFIPQQATNYKYLYGNSNYRTFPQIFLVLSANETKSYIKIVSLITKIIGAYNENGIQYGYFIKMVYIRLGNRYSAFFI